MYVGGMEFFSFGLCLSRNNTLIVHKEELVDLLSLAYAFEVSCMAIFWWVIFLMLAAIVAIFRVNRVTTLIPPRL